MASSSVGKKKISKLPLVHHCPTCGSPQNSSDENASGDANLHHIKNEEDTSISEEIKQLRKQLMELEGKCKSLVFENEKVNIDLVHERHRVGQLERKLQYVKDNQEIFDKLKEAYVSMKYNESSSRKLIEIRDKSVQTWDGIICRNCIETEKMRKDLEVIKLKFDNSVIITNDQMLRLNSTLEDLKDCAFTLSSSPSSLPKIRGYDEGSDGINSNSSYSTID